MVKILPEQMKNVITIDPGWHTAICRWTSAEKHVMTMIVSPKNQDPEWKLEYMWNKFAEFLGIVLGNHDIEAVIIEGTELWARSAVSTASASSGDLIYLSYLIGGYASQLHDLDIPFHIVPPSVWKGQLTKEAIAGRVRRRLGIEASNEHANHAIALGLAVSGRL